MVRKEKSKKTATKIPHEVEARIVEVSLQNPDYGERRLVPLLEQEGITVTNSAVYTILKRNNLHNRSLRLSKLEKQRVAEIVPEPATTIEPPAEEPAPVPAHTGGMRPESRVSPAIKVPKKSKVRRPYSLTVPNLLLLGLVGYFWVSAAVNFLQAGREPVLSPQPAPAEATSKAEATVRPLEDYSIIVERNLFGSSAAKTPAPEETVPLEDIPNAEESLGLKLIGTVAGDDSATSFAIIENKTTRKQELYREGDKAGEVLIKSILRNNVIVDAGRGEKLLALELEESGKKLDFSPAFQPPVRKKGPTRKEEALRFDRVELETALANVDLVTQELSISPYMRAGKPAGFRIGKIPAESILVAMGLRTGDLIRGVNDQAITGPEQAAKFFQRLKQGGDVTIKVGKGRGVRMRGRLIHLKIE
jgi:type II secretion system protein C